MDPAVEGVAATCGTDAVAEGHAGKYWHQQMHVARGGATLWHEFMIGSEAIILCGTGSVMVQGRLGGWGGVG